MTGKERVQELLKLPENSICADCQRKAAKWASTTLGIFICIDCSGIHRSLGTHISFVRSCTLDEWSSDQVQIMESIGNKVANEYWEAKLPEDFKRPEGTYEMTNFIKSKYVNSKWAGSGDPPGKVKSEAPDKQMQRSKSKGRIVIQIEDDNKKSDETGLEQFLGRDMTRSRSSPKVTQSQVSSADRKPGRKIPARLARKMAKEESPVRRQRCSGDEASSDDDPFA